MDWGVSVPLPDGSITGQLIPPSRLARFVQESHLSTIAPNAVGATRTATAFKRHDRESELTILTPTSTKIERGDVIEGFLLVEFPGIENFDEARLRQLTVRCSDFEGTFFAGTAESAAIYAEAIVEKTEW
jgi:hypothetical protein